MPVCLHNAFLNSEDTVGIRQNSSGRSRTPEHPYLRSW
ncbi:hypothetical protein T4D_14375 [Trichinella pseudospiralis]|uniref:Uncharacterized protein n=1 Tax=Trichinella pseudospiralis TaxID=6337 RepID=A0A0V1D125_TRIPS|nr:hypothetical protein T4D_14375 [Trichinella pseudospiralis]